MTDEKPKRQPSAITLQTRAYRRVATLKAKIAELLDRNDAMKAKFQTKSEALLRELATAEAELAKYDNPDQQASDGTA